jgi:4-carboxymuconolactone decarboxylase
MTNARLERGLEVRKDVLTEAHVQNTLNNTDAFTGPLQDLINEYCWGVGWADGSLARAKRSILTLGILASSGRFTEFETHVRASLRNGVTVGELRAVVTHIAIYCGMPTAVESARSMQKVLKAEGAY